ncbi:MAG: RDD family protein [Arenimonas sp.]
MQDQNSNPYATPDAPVVDFPSEGPELASFGIRLLGAIIDGVLMMVLVFPLVFALGLMNMSDIMAGIQPTLVDNLKMGTLGFFVFLLVQGYFLNASGQTIGKKILGTKIVTQDNQKPEFVKLILTRYATIHAIGQIPILGGLFGFVNVLFIFIGDQRQCLHDKFAGTKVIVAK